MAKKSISDLLDYSLFIFDLDNTIYNEEDYLFQAYKVICERFSRLEPGLDKKSLFDLMIKIYHQEGRDKLFDRFFETTGSDKSHMDHFLRILRTFTPEKPLLPDKTVREFLHMLVEKKKNIYVLTNGNPQQQRNKIRHIEWDGLEKHISFIFAEEVGRKPSPAGVLHILKTSGIGNKSAIFIGDKETDRICAQEGGVQYLDIKELKELPA